MYVHQRDNALGDEITGEKTEARYPAVAWGLRETVQALREDRGNVFWVGGVFVHGELFVSDWVSESVPGEINGRHSQHLASEGVGGFSLCGVYMCVCVYVC